MRKILSFVPILLFAVTAVAQSGGGYNLEQNVIGNGGWRSDGGVFRVLGTMGQGNAGSTASGGGFHLIDGLWAIENPAANSPFASVSGKITQRNGVGIPRVLVVLMSPTIDLTLQTWTEAKGEYRFPEIPTGHNYIIMVSHNHFEFNPGLLSVFVSQNRPNVDFVSIQ